jgi:tubulin polyglutamylase TTLL6/13
MDKGHKRSLSAIYNIMNTNGIDSKALKNKIDELIIKTLLVGQPMIAHTYSLAQSDNHVNDLCFHILGFDILINDRS